MVEFKETMGGFDVLVEGKLFGHLQKKRGFFTDPTVVKEFLEVSSEDLLEIALKADEVKKCGNIIPICPTCKGTPIFPLSIYSPNIYSPNKGMRSCQSQFHSSSIRNFRWIK